MSRPAVYIQWRTDEPPTDRVIKMRIPASAWKANASARLVFFNGGEWCLTTTGRAVAKPNEWTEADPRNR